LAGIENKESKLMKDGPEMPTAESNSDDVHMQLKRLLEHRAFKGSRRCARLLEYLVEHRLQGDTVPPKERTLGIEVFERETDYDTADDPVVRSVANEIRKRIAQYYIEPGHESELHIDLPLGSYVPEFHLPEEKTQSRTLLPAHPVRSGLFRYLVIPVTVALILFVLGVIWLRSPSALDRFWSPVLESHNRVLICVLAFMPATSDGGAQAQTNTGVNPIMSPLGIPFIPLNDNKALVNILQFLDGKNAKTETQYQSQARNAPDSSVLPRLADSSKGPVVVLGRSDWTRLNLASLRFRVAQDGAAGLFWVEDVKDPSVTKWKVNSRQSYGQYTEDYAIISRISDDMTGQTLVYLTGLGSYGIGAAGEFVTNESLMSEVASGSSPEWQKKNLQIVISSKISGGAWGNPQVLAKYFW
jgi:hypothetical protein